MDREFMAGYFERVYDGSVYKAVSGNAEYNQLRTELMEVEDRLLTMAGGQETSLWELHEQSTQLLLQMNRLTIKEVYLMGAADRERMLR